MRLIYTIESTLISNMKLSVARLSLLILCLAQWVSAATVYFPITLTWANRTVAGVTRPIILTNGQFPAPALRLTQNDEVVFDVVNLCPFTTTVHFHGKSQCPSIHHTR